ncbi:tetratricopeptide repeat protein [Nemorincola caseinilytica]|uniref:Tetratricopeptide repeat protein n=1 Tax=Nemorincola caseinilytica TaxID=2054315 RepID=A0ABP8NI91_9BACT
MNRPYNHPGIPAYMRVRQAFGLLVCIVVLLAGIPAQAQVSRYMLDGNDLYNQKKYKEAAERYNKALAKNPNYTPGMFNLGNTLYQQQKFDSSRKVMDAARKISQNKQGRAAADYNIGNTYMAEKKWDDAITAFKQTLRNNPQDADAKYNLSYALKMKAQGEGGGKNDKDKKDDKKDDKNKDKDKKDDKKDKKDDQQNQPNENKQDKDKQDQPQPQPGKVSKQAAEQLLNALQNEEKKLQEKMNKEKGAPVKPDKDW